MENQGEDSEIKLPKYRVDGFSTSLEGDSIGFITLHVRLRGKLLNIGISSPNLRNSPSMTEDFYKYLEIARSDSDALDDDLMCDLFDWATKPFLPHFIDQAQGSSDLSKEAVTLQDFLYPETFDCEFTAVDDKFMPGQIRRQKIQEAQDVSNLGDEFSHLKAQLELVHPSQVELRPENPHETPDLPDAQPHRVSVNGQILFFKSVAVSNLQDTMNAIRKYLLIAALGSHLRTSQILGIVADDKNPLIGLLFHYIDVEDTLAFAVEPSTPEALKRQWAAQITDTLGRLHQGGVVWGDVKPDNVLIDAAGDAWIVDFEGGYTEGWVDGDMAGSVAGDAQGLDRIVAFIFEERMEFGVGDGDEGEDGAYDDEG